VPVSLPDCRTAMIKTELVNTSKVYRNSDIWGL